MNTRNPALVVMATIALLGHPLPGQEPVLRSDPRIGISPPMPPPRVELRAPDVGPMQTREMSVNATINGLHAVVETTLVFHNPNARELEGELVFPLPDGAAVCGYALDIGGVLVDGVIVPKDRARVAFETETRRLVDPGLVEHVQGNLYRTRIYPLPAKGERRIRVTYTTPLAIAPDGDAALLLPMPRETIATLKVHIEVAAHDDTRPQIGGLGDARFEQAERHWKLEFAGKHTTPAEDIMVALPKLPTAFHRLERDADGSARFMITTIAPPAKAEPAAPGHLHVLWDASGSRADEDLAAEFALLGQATADSYVLTVFRDLPEEPREFATLAELLVAIKEAPFDGGTDLAALAAGMAGLPAKKPGDVILLFTDGFDTLSGQPLDLGGLQPIAVVSQTIADRESLRQACAGALIDLRTMDAAAAWSEITHPSGRVTGVRGTGIAEVQGIGQAAYGRISLLGLLTVPEASVRIQFADGSESEPFVLRRDAASESRVLATAWASARINQLTPRANEFEEELLELGRTHGIVSPVTSLIVLETLDQWVRHRIEPPASLPDMRRQWRQAVKALPNEDQTDSKQELERVVKLWQQRVEWWNTDFSKAKPNARGRDVARSPAYQPAPSAAAIGPAEDTAADPFAATDGARLEGRLPAGGGGGGWGGLPSEAGGASQAAIEVKPWEPDTPYLKTLRETKPEQRYTAYLAERATWSRSPAFFLDCAEWFYREGERMLGRRILSNLAELRIEDAGLLRVLAWRLLQADDLDTATIILRRVAKLRPEEPQSFRDLALALAERGRDSGAPADLEEALALFLKVALNPWDRHGESIALLAIEEMNALIAWIDRRNWPDGGRPRVPEFDKRLADNLHTDIRIVMVWDADATDMDLHVIEPGGEEAYFGHNRTARGGLVSDDITDGYGPEEYLIRSAPAGDYIIEANYYGSSQQTVVGPATVTATVFTNWGRADETRETLTVRLEKPEERIAIGTITFGRGSTNGKVGELRTGLTRDQVMAALGAPADPSANPWVFPQGPKTLQVFFDDNGALNRVTETLPGGHVTIIVQ